MKTITCWKLESIAESGQNWLVARFETQQAATDAQGCAGGYGPSIAKEVITIYESAVEFAPRLNIAAAQSGLAKLTTEEKLALGLENK